MKETTPDFREVIDNPDVFSAWIEERYKLKAEIAENEEALKRIDKAITAHLTDSGQVKVKYGEATVALVESSRSNLSKERLVELGVPTSVIKQATDTIKFTYLLVR